MQKKNFLIAIVTILLIAVLGTAVFVFQDDAGFTGTRATLKPNPEHRELTDITVLDDASKTKVITLSDVYRDHYHASEVVGGNLYVIRRTEMKEDGTLGQDWTDTLWKYSADGVGEPLYSARGLDFRVAPDASVIAIVVAAEADAGVLMLSTDGEIRQHFRPAELGMSGDLLLMPVGWSGDRFWMAAKEGRLLRVLASIEVGTGTIVSHDVAALDVADQEFAVSPDGASLAFSDFVSALEVEGDVGPRETKLYRYDLATSRKDLVLTVMASEPLKPRWIDDQTLEYGIDGKRETKRVQ